MQHIAHGLRMSRNYIMTHMYFCPPISIFDLRSKMRTAVASLTFTTSQNVFVLPCFIEIINVANSTQNLFYCAIFFNHIIVIFSNNL